MKREYPLFLIDRSKSGDYPHDFVVCLDREAGFVAKIVHFPTDKMYNEFKEKILQIESHEISGIYHDLKTGGIVLQVVDFLYYFDLTDEIKSRIVHLLKKAMKKFLHAEAEQSYDGADFNIEKQKTLYGK